MIIKTVISNEFGGIRVTKYGNIKFDETGNADVADHVAEALIKTAHIELGIQPVVPEPEIKKKEVGIIESETLGTDNTVVESKESDYKREELELLTNRELREILIKAGFTNEDLRELQNKTKLINFILQ